VIAPPTFVCETNQYAHRQPNDDGYIGHSWELPITGCRMVRGGHDYEFFRPVVPSDRITVTWRLENISERVSSGGTPMLIVLAAATYTNQHGERLARNRETLIYQPLEATRGSHRHSKPWRSQWAIRFRRSRVHSRRSA
jgi:N-terminal half of MaoC dehydratase